MVIVAKRLLFGKEEGATIVEYALALVLIAVVSLAVITALGTKLSSLFNTMAASI